MDSLTQEEIRVGALIVDSGKEGVPISAEDFEFLKLVGELIGAAVGKAELTEQLMESYRRKVMVKETAHILNFSVWKICILNICACLGLIPAGCFARASNLGFHGPG